MLPYIVLFLFPLLALLLLYIYYIYMLETQQYIVIIITSYTTMYFKEVEKRKEKKYIFIEFVILSFLSTICSSLHLFLWV